MVTADLWDVAAEVTDPEMPMLTLADLGVLRAVERDGGRIVATITPTYAGCPALDAMAADLRSTLGAYGEVEVKVTLTPPWTTDLISDEGRRKLAEAGVAPPAHIGPRSTGPVPLALAAPPKRVTCPRCGSAETEELSRFGPTACTALRRCRACAEPFEHMKDI
ncbi:1,2-phenylacetyl-CoA epoxidase subunit PaaD [Actinomycetospora termitidis]|uniref:1,2-phenylacetyl-CoA epoxidase subunit PaaD n=1 Tax=Actinomycetospora termitidis TaxID=3053470 RepID=A0ABT7MDM8_9PSEU|nr:1,2-phenylacetyl-CoA epoxidase subunit PaaD [Actinomycetospora sp. Odt1-22]MDL5158770.1 1,2-phenylacetyl-CoA epoxidase subunit PaaD [Actinomycetospora sp. Odt1-22]